MKGTIEIDGKIFISASRAAEITRYSKDYIGQLCRHAKVKAKLIGRGWFVEEADLLRYKKESDEQQNNRRHQASEIAKEIYRKDENGYFREIPTAPKTEKISYFSDDRPLMPIISKVVSQTAESAIDKPAVSAAGISQIAVIAKKNPRRVADSYKMNVADMMKSPRALSAVAALFMIIGFVSLNFALVSGFGDSPAIAKLSSFESSAGEWFIDPFVALGNDSVKIFGSAAATARDTVTGALSDFFQNSPLAVSTGTMQSASIFDSISSGWHSLTDTVRTAARSWLGIRDYAAGPSSGQTTTLAVKVNPPQAHASGTSTIVQRIVEKPQTVVISQMDQTLLSRVSNLESFMARSSWGGMPYNASVPPTIYSYVNNQSAVDAESSGHAISAAVQGITQNGSLANPTITGATITGSSFSGSTGAFTGALSIGGMLTVNNAAGTSTFAGDSSFAGGTLYIDSINHRVGVGTTSPADTFSVAGPIYLANVSPATTANRLYANGNDLYWAGSLIGGATTANWTTNGTNAWRATGNVGVGTTSPFAALSIGGYGTSTGYAFAVSDIASSTKFVIMNDGSVGIGTTSPAGLLGVSGGGFFAGDLTASNITATGTATFANLLLSGSSTLQNFTFANATGTSATTTNLFASIFNATTGAITNGTIANFNSSFGTTTNATSTNLFASNFNATNLTSTGATTTNLFSTTASSTNLFSTNFNLGSGSIGSLSAGALTLGSFNGPLQANNGLVSATTSIGAIYGGTGQTAVTAGDLLYGSAANAWSRLGIGTGGYVLGVSNGLPAWVATTTLANISGTLAVGSGGTGATSFPQ
ncbi:MAG: hypothetical protein KGI23_03055, partial [Patescibacteria group bacterium]|nr:hypothetical protein [Patescibacteria group bacterium]